MSPWDTPLGSHLGPRPPTALPPNSYSKDYDPEDWLHVDGATGQVQTQRVLSPASPFLKDGWYRAVILAQDDGEPGARPGPPLLPKGSGLGAPPSRPAGGGEGSRGPRAHQARPACSLTTQHGHWDPVH